MTEKKTLRCAVYTRVSTDAGLEQDFNSLNAQREAAEAYIKSQGHEGWKLVRQAYDDGGFSGGSLDRPALRQLLDDVRASKIDVIVVYKVDRLTRSLADFAKLVELFDQYGASFVSVTQAFNTTTSMGRLTLNVLLSFAQFEREVTAERIRDKIAASKKKGIWMGGNSPLGYSVRDRKLVVVPEEAETVRGIFKRYLELGSTLPLLEELHHTGVRTRLQRRQGGKVRGGVSFMRGALNYLLRNRMYLGELKHHKECYPGEHEPIVDREVFDAVQALLDNNTRVFHGKRRGSGALLVGKLFDERGNLMTPNHTTKRGVRYNYYVCRLLVEGRRAEAADIRRLPAVPLERSVVEKIRCTLQGRRDSLESISDSAIVQAYLKRAVVFPERLVLTVRSRDGASTTDIEAAWTKPPGRPKREILLPHADPEKNARPVRAEMRESVVRALALGKSWLTELLDNPNLTIEMLAMREDRSKRSVQMMLSLNFLSPQIVRALIAGKLPRGIGITRLTHLPPDWTRQLKVLGLAAGTE